MPDQEVDVAWVADAGLMMQAEGMSALLHTYQSLRDGGCRDAEPVAGCSERHR